MLIHFMLHWPNPKPENNERLVFAGYYDGNQSQTEINLIMPSYSPGGAHFVVTSKQETLNL